MNYKKLTVQELKNICKKNNIKGYSYLNKEDLIKIIKKNLKKMKGGNDGNKVNYRRVNDDIILDRKTLLQILGYSSEYIFHSKNNAALKELTSIDLSNMNITEIKQNTFSGLSKLETLNLSNNKINKIELNAFRGLSNLKELNLNDNSITNIDGGILRGLRDLNYLTLNHNIINIIDSFSFNDLKDLKTLDLSNNKITTLTDREFTGLKSLETLNLSNNEINKINANPFFLVNNLKYLNLLNNNELTENHIKNLYDYFKYYQSNLNLKSKFNNKKKN